MLLPTDLMKKKHFNFFPSLKIKMFNLIDRDVKCLGLHKDVWCWPADVYDSLTEM